MPGPGPAGHLAPVMTLRGRILLAFGAAVLVMSALGALAMRGAGATIGATRLTVQAVNDLQLLTNLRDWVAALDESERDYVYTPTDEHLAAYTQARSLVLDGMALLRRDVHGNTSLAPVLASLEPLVAAKLAFTDAVVAARQTTAGDAAVLALIRSRRGWELTDDIRLHLSSMRLAERQDLLAGSARLERLAHAARLGIGIGGGIVLILLAGAAVRIAQEAHRRAVVQQRLAANELVLRETAHDLQDLYDHAPVGYHSLDADGLVVRMNDTELDWLGYAREEVVGRMHWADLMPADERAGFYLGHPRLKETGHVANIELALQRRDGSLLPVMLSATAVRDPAGRFVMSRSVVVDMTDLRRARDEQAGTIALLEEALASVRTLSGMLPICSTCKKIRDDAGYWRSVEAYVSEHADVRFSHGVCPECFPKMFPGVDQPDPPRRSRG